MTTLVVTGTGFVGPDGSGPRPVPATDLAPPGNRAFLAAGFDAEAELGRRTTRFNHRSTLLAIAACGAALRDARLTADEEARNGIGVTLGTMCGSVSGTASFGWATFSQPRPYNVDPSCFPNLIINTAAGAVAIKYGLRGANSTVAGGPVAGVIALRHAALTLRAGHADTVLVGACEEYGIHEAWLAAALRPGAVTGEGAAILVLESAEVADRGGRPARAAVGAALTRAIDVTDADQIRTLLIDVLHAAGQSASRIRHVALRATGHAQADAAARAAVTSTLPVPPSYVEHRIGDCYTAHAAIQLVGIASLADAERWTPDDVGIVLALDPDGLAGAAVLTGPPKPTCLSTPYDPATAKER
jgi:3-oxoacyl-[acyl-carrier-protein] synthase II